MDQFSDFSPNALSPARISRFQNNPPRSARCSTKALPKVVALVTPLTVALLLTAAAQAPPPAGPVNARNFPAHSSQQGVTIAAVPVPDTPDAEKIFGRTAAPTRAGFLPVEIIISNRREKPIVVRLEGIAIFSGRDRFEQVSTAVVSEGLYPKPEEEIKDPTRPRRRLPIPWPRGKKKPKDKLLEPREEAEAALRSRQLRSAQVLPGGFARGYLYFDLRRGMIDLEVATLYIPQVEEKDGGEKLLFFEISLKPYALP